MDLTSNKEEIQVVDICYKIPSFPIATNWNRTRYRVTTLISNFNIFSDNSKASILLYGAVKMFLEMEK